MEPQISKDAVLMTSEKIPENTPTVKGYEWNDGINYSDLLKSFTISGFQSTNLGLGIEEINRMVSSSKLATPQY